MGLRNWLKRFVPGDPVSKVCDTRNLNRIANVLEDIDVIGRNGIDATINKPTEAEGLGWMIVVDGAKLRAMSGGRHWGKLVSPTEPSNTAWSTGPGDALAGDGVIAAFNGATVQKDSSAGTITITPITRSMMADANGNLRQVSVASQGTPVVLRENMGVDGDDGVGIKSITEGTATQSGGYTVTPITIELTDGNTISLSVRAKNGEDGEDGARGPRGYQGEQGPPGPTVQVQKRVVIGVRYDETSHQLQVMYSTITCQGYQDDAKWTPFTTAVAEMP